MQIKISILLVLIQMVASVWGGVPGTGDVGTGYDGGGCSSCAGGGGGDFNLIAGLRWSADLGNNPEGTSGEMELRLRSLVDLDTTWYMVSVNLIKDGSYGQQVVKDSVGHSRQVVAKQAFVDLQLIDPYTLTVTFYPPTAKGALIPATGLYSINSGATAMTTWRFQNPDGAGAQNRLTIQEAPAGSGSRSWAFTCDPITFNWSVTMPDSSIQNSMTSFATGARVETVDIISPPATLVRHWSIAYINLSWGEMVAARVVGSGAAAQVTSYSYYAGLSDAGFSPDPSVPAIKQITNPDGSWVYYLNYDAFGRPLTILHGFGTTPTTDQSACWSTVYEYNPVDATDQLDSNNQLKVHKMLPRTVTEKFMGTAVKKKYHVYTSTSHTEAVCVNLSAAYGDPSCLYTVTKYVGFGTDADRTSSISYPDGTIETYSYTSTSSGRTTVVSRGQPGTSGVAEGIQTVTVTGLAGEMQSRTNYNITGSTPGIVLSTEYCSDFDTYLRPKKMFHLDGTFETYSYSCCGLDTVVDRDGVSTSFGYDVMKRQITSIRSGIVTSNILDCSGQRLGVQRYGTDSSIVTLESNGYDSAGFMTSSTNAFGGVSVFTRSLAGGAFHQSVTNPDGGVIDTSYNADGSLSAVVGTGAFPKQYLYGVESTSDTETGTHTFLFEQKIKPDSGNHPIEWVKTYRDAAGRVAKVAYQDGAYSIYLYNALGQLAKYIDPDKVAV